MMKQNLLEILDEVNKKLDLKSKQAVQYAWQVDGTRIKSLMDIHQQCRVILVSAEKQFIGLKGISQLNGFMQVRRAQEVESIKPKPATWIQTAAVSWLHQNHTTDVPNIADTSNSYQGTDSNDVRRAGREGQIIEALRNEHVRVHLQDQELLSQIRMSQNQKGGKQQTELGTSSRNSNRPSSSKDLLSAVDPEDSETVIEDEKRPSPE